MTPTPACTACGAALSIDGFDPARKELSCGGCGRVAVVVRGRAPLGSIPLPARLRVRRGETLVLTWSRPWTGIAAGVGLALVVIALASAAPALGAVGAVAAAAGAWGWRSSPRIVAGVAGVEVWGGVRIPRDELVQVYVVRGPAGVELRARGRSGADWLLVNTATLWDALAIEHLLEAHLQLPDAPVGP